MLRQEGGVVYVVDHRGTDIGLRVYRKEVMEGNTINNRIIKVKHGNARSKRRPNAVVSDTGEGGANIRESIPDVSRFLIDMPEGKSCRFDMIGMCGGLTGCVFKSVSSF